MMTVSIFSHTAEMLYIVTGKLVGIVTDCIIMKCVMIRLEEMMRVL